jgi:hypothetical protein
MYCTSATLDIAKFQLVTVFHSERQDNLELVTGNL